jgi:hypothetical protein
LSHFGIDQQHFTGKKAAKAKQQQNWPSDSEPAEGLRERFFRVYVIIITVTLTLRFRLRYRSGPGALRTISFQVTLQLEVHRAT